MELPIIELREKIAEELEKNPALELVSEPESLSLDMQKGVQKEVEEYIRNSPPSGTIARVVAAPSARARDEKQQFIEGALSRPETLQDHLLWQIRLEALDEDVRRIGERLIQNLNSDGFHREPVDVLLAGETRENIDAAMKAVRALDPEGTCTADYLESLAVQIDLLENAPKGIREALSQLSLLERGKFAQAAKHMGVREEDAREIYKKLRELSPFPGRSFSSGTTRFVTPDIQVVNKDGEFVIILNEEEIPVLGINPFFMKVVDAPAGSLAGPGFVEAKEKRKNEKPVRDFAREKIKEARWFINAINRRNHTLVRVTRAIVEFQRAFFAKGPAFIAPLTLADIAGELGLHEATISRTANGKYMQTEWGIFEIKYFFSNSVGGSGSSPSRFSKTGVKEIIRELVASEAARLSDKDIVGLLAKRGIVIARRTVAKYRGELDLGSSYQRR